MNSLLVSMAFNYAVGRLKEASTWASIAAAIAASYNIQFNGDFRSAFIATGLAMATLLGIFIKEGAKK